MLCLCPLIFKASNKLENNSETFVKTQFEHFNPSKGARPYVVHMHIFIGLHVQINMNYLVITAIYTFALSFCVYVCGAGVDGAGLDGKGSEWLPKWHSCY